MGFLDNRQYWHTEKKSPDVFRIVCLGDSLTFGCGVVPQESLPYQLESILNRSVWEPIVEVVNAGVCGFSLYDDWNFYCHDVYRYQPDYLIIVLCNNDPELFSTQGNYLDHVKACWEEQGKHLPYFRKALAEIGTHVSALGIHCVVSFYDISGEQDIETYASVLKDICAQNGLSFVNLASEFTGEFSGNRNPAVKVSSVDGHPSRLAHQAAAQKLARHITRDKTLFPNKAGAGEEELYRKIFSFGISLQDYGLQPETSIYRTQELLNAKRNGRGRSMVEPGLLIDDQRFARLQDTLAATAEFNYRVLFLEGLAERCKRNSLDFYNWIENAEKSILKIEKHFFVLEENLRNPALSYYPSCKEDTGGDFSAFPPGIAFLLDSVQTIVSDYVTLPPPPAGDMPRPLLAVQDGCAGKTARAAVPVLSLLETFRGKLQSSRALFDRFLKLFNANKDRRSQQPFLSFFVLLSQELMMLLKELQATYVSLNLQEIKPLSLPLTNAPFTVFSAVIKSSSAIVPNIFVKAESIIPFRQPLRDTQYIINDGEAHEYSFQFPFFTLGRFMVHLTSKDNTIIEKMTVYSNATKPIQYSNIGDTIDFNLPVALIPI